MHIILEAVNEGSHGLRGEVHGRFTDDDLPAWSKVGGPVDRCKPHRLCMAPHAEVLGVFEGGIYGLETVQFSFPADLCWVVRSST